MSKLDNTKEQNSNPSANNALLEVLVNATNILQNGAMFLNAEGHILGTNRRLVEELGYKPEDYSPKTIFEVNPTTSFLSWKKMWKLAQKERQFEVNSEQLTVDNSIYPIIMRGAMIEIEGIEICIVLTENIMASNRYKDLLDITSEIVNIGSWERDLVKDEILFSNEMYKILSIKKTELLNWDTVRKSVMHLVDPKEFESVEQDLANVIKTGGTLEREVALSVNSQFTTYRLVVRSETYEGRTIKLIGTIQNLNKIDKQVSGLYFTQFVMDNAREMIFCLDENLQITYVNKSSCETFGYTKEEMIGKNISLIDPDFIAREPEFNKKLEREKNILFRTWPYKKDGTHFPVSIIANLVEFDGKKVNCAFVRDLSVANQKDEILSIVGQSLDKSKDIVVTLREDGSFKYCNETFFEKSGYSKEELEALNIVDIIEDTNSEIYSATWESLKGGNIIEAFIRKLITKSGNIIPVEVSVDMIKVGTEYFSTNVFRDITIRMEKELQIQGYIAQIEELQISTAAQNLELREEIEKEFNFGNIISKDPNYRKVLLQVDKVAATNATVLIHGETGTGKELLARAIHQNSIRSEKPMVKVNCSTLPENLIESELFGHEKGAFTGAYQRKIGKFERADKGTIFLDEIGELPLEMQAKLLRVLQEGEIERVGGSELIHLDVRVIVATNRNLESRVDKGKFREDLFYRLNVFPIRNLPLRERSEDIAILAEHFVRIYNNSIGRNITQISSRSMDSLMKYNFPGNIRELENIIERAVILCQGKTLHIDNQLLQGKRNRKDKKFLTLEEAQRKHIINALKRTSGKVSGPNGAANLLNMNDKTLTSKMNKLDITKKEIV